MNPTISEFSYGYALTDELVHARDFQITAAPVFPSLYDEGQAGGGWDLRLDRPAVPLFLQFKLSHCMVRGNCRERRDGRLGVPCYRMHLRPKRFSRQHELLLDLEGNGHEVYYSAPGFHNPDELNAAYLGKQVRSRSLWLRPSQIGPLPDERDHHVSFQPGGAWYFYSEPRRGDGPADFSGFLEHIRAVLGAPNRRPLGEESFEKLAEDIASVGERRPDISSPQKDTTRTVLAEVPALRRSAYYASIYLESQLVLMQSTEVSPPSLL